MRRLLATTFVTALVAAPIALITPAEAAVPAKWANCTVVNKRLPHGVGLAKARDKTSGTPVTNFRRDSALYRTAMAANARLDGDKDGIACEKA